MVRRPHQPVSLSQDRASKSQFICHVLTDQRRMLAARVHQYPRFSPLGSMCHGSAHHGCKYAGNVWSSGIVYQQRFPDTRGVLAGDACSIGLVMGTRLADGFHIARATRLLRRSCAMFCVDSCTCVVVVSTSVVGTTKGSCLLCHRQSKALRIRLRSCAI